MSPTIPVAADLDLVLRAAVAEPEFRRALLADREAALRARGFVLGASELETLRSVSEAQLEQMIERLRFAPPRPTGPGPSPGSDGFPPPAGIRPR